MNPETGEIFVNGCSADVGISSEVGESCLDFESQKSYVLTYTGTDGGGQVNLIESFHGTSF